MGSAPRIHGVYSAHVKSVKCCAVIKGTIRFASEHKAKIEVYSSIECSKWPLVHKAREPNQV